MAEREAATPQAIIRRKRDGAALTADEIGTFIAALVAGEVSNEQAAAFLMAVFLRSMDRDETVALTQAMMRSGAVLEWAGFDGPIIDKHSTGGVGDNVSLMLAPAIAACGGFVPMISGRSLGHSGGTLDKLEAIPGYDVRPERERFRRVVKEIGCAIIGQTADLAPADGTLYAIRDVTATVESIPLITASILSKKLAAGLGALVMDVKTGSGAFMTEREDAQALARSLVAVASGAGLPTSALITDMNEPLASAAGNALEIRNAVDYLTGKARDPRLHAVVVALGAEMLRLGGLARDRATGARAIETALASGAAAERFGRMVAALGGPADFIARMPTYLRPAAVIRPVMAERSGHVVAIDARAVGLAVVALGGGRARSTDTIDPRVGFSALAPLGASMHGEPIGIVHACTEHDADRAATALRRAYRIGAEVPAPHAPVIETLFYEDAS